MFMIFMRSIYQTSAENANTNLHNNAYSFHWCIQTKLMVW